VTGARPWAAAALSGALCVLGPLLVACGARGAQRASLVEHETPLRRDGAEFPFTVPAGVTVLEVAVDLPPGLEGGAEIGPLIPVGRLPGAWRIDPDRSTRLALGAGNAGPQRVPCRTPGAWMLRVEPIPMAMGAGEMPPVHVLVRAAP